MSKNPNDVENTVPYEQINPGALRKEAEKHGSADPEKHAAHERELAKLDHGMGHKKGGR